MSDNAIDSESISKPGPDTAKPKGARKAGSRAQPKLGAGPLFLWHDKINGKFS
jgi:hypothetical protein